MELTENGSLLSKTMQTLWKETKFHNSIDTLAWRRPVDSKWRITLVLSSCGAIGSRGINHLLKTGDGSGWHILACVLFALKFHSPCEIEKIISASASSVFQTPCAIACYRELYFLLEYPLNIWLIFYTNQLMSASLWLAWTWTWKFCNCRKLLILRNCRIPLYVILPLHCHQVLNL